METELQAPVAKTARIIQNVQQLYSIHFVHHVQFSLAYRQRLVYKLCELPKVNNYQPRQRGEMRLGSSQLAL
jgi:hypothetical protein